jgi:hypothetical protein
MENFVEHDKSFGILSEMGRFAYENYTSETTSSAGRHDELTHLKYIDIPAFKDEIGRRKNRNFRTQTIKRERTKFGQALNGRLLTENVIQNISDTEKLKIFSRSDLKKGAEYCENKCREIHEAFMKNGTTDRRVGERSDDVKAKQQKVTKRGPELDGLIMEICRSHFNLKGGYIGDDQLRKFMAEVTQMRPELKSEVISSSAACRFFRDQMKVSRWSGSPLSAPIKLVRKAHIQAEPMAGSTTTGIHSQTNQTMIKSHQSRANKKVTHYTAGCVLVLLLNVLI